MYLNTARIPWAVLRTGISASDTAQSTVGFNYADMPLAKTVKLKDAPLADANGLVIAFYGGDAADEAAAYKLYGRCRCNGPIQLLLEGVITLGAMALTADPVGIVGAFTNVFWADTITVTGGLFSDSAITTISDSGNERICQLKFDQTHIDDLYCELALTTTDSMYAIISGY